MRIAFDQQVFLLQKYGGISRYVCSVAEQLARLPDVSPKIFAPIHTNRCLRGEEGQSGRKLFLPQIPNKLFRAVSAVSSRIAESQIGRFRPDIFHETYFSDDGIAVKGSKRVLTMYDMIFERFPELFGSENKTTEAKRHSVSRADLVICISESTRRDLLEIFDIPRERTAVVHLGVDHKTFFSKDGPKQESEGKPYLMFVGGRDYYKNFSGLLEAFGNSNTLRNNFDLVCFGGGEITAAEKKQIVDSNIPLSQVKYFSGSDESLADLYRGASALVYPSLYEGFGLPLLEAMACSCAVVCTQSSSLPEVGGDAANYFEPGNAESLTNAIERVVESGSFRDDLVSKGIERSRGFTWEKCAKEHFSNYHNIL